MLPYEGPDSSHFRLNSYTDLEFDGSYMKHIDIEFEHISNAHNMQNIKHNMVHRHHDLDLNQEYFHCFKIMTGRHIRATV